MESLTGSMREESARHNLLVESDAFTLASDPRKPFVAPDPKGPVPHLNFAPLRNSLVVLKERARVHDAAMQAHGTSLDRQQQRALNEILMHLERAMSRSEGLPGRPWYRHQIYAPGLLTGYGVKTLPGVREAIEARDWDEAESQVVIAAGVLDRVASEIARATLILQGQ